MKDLNEQVCILKALYKHTAIMKNERTAIIALMGKNESCINI